MSRKIAKRFMTACGVAALLGAGLANNSALAATDTSTFQVTADVVAVCSISANDLTFGNYDPFAAGDLDVNGSIDVTCTDQAPWEIQLDGGGTGDVNARQMSDGGTGTLDYELHTNAGRTSNWGETLTVDTVTGTGTGASQSVTVFGRIPSGQTGAPAGSYSDTVTATINF